MIARFILILIVFAVNHAFSQKSDTNIIVKKGDRGELISLEFNSSGNKNGTVFVPKQQNPYGQLSYSIIKEETSGYKIYDLSNTSKQIIENQFENLPNEPFEPGSLITYFEYDVNDNKSNTIISYRLDLYNNLRQFLCAKTQIIILNSKGEEILHSDEYQSGLSYPSLTKSGKYLVMTYGGESHESFEEQGFIIIEASTGEDILDQKAEKDHFMAKPFTQGELIIISEDGGINKQIRKYTIIDPDNRIKYVKSYNRSSSLFSTLINLKIESDGLVFETSNGTIKEFYTSEFDSFILN